MDFHLDRAEQKLLQQRKMEAAQRKREAAKRAAAKAKAERESAERDEKLAPVLEAQRRQLEELQSQREAAERERAAAAAVVKGAGRKMRRTQIPQLCFRGHPPPVERLDREKILAEEADIAAAVASVDPGSLAELLLVRFGTKGASASSRNGSARQERSRVCNAMRLSMVAQPDTAYALVLATVDRLASSPSRTAISEDHSVNKASRGGGKAQTRNPSLPMCLLLDTLVATGLVPVSSDTELAEGFVLGALQRPGWFEAACVDASSPSSTLQPEPEPETLPESQPEPRSERQLTRAVSPRVLIQLMRIYAVCAASIPFADRSAFALGLLRSKSGNLKDVSLLVEVFELPFDPPYILTDLCKCQRWHVAVRYACGVGKRGGAAAASWAKKWTAALDVLITALNLGHTCPEDASTDIAQESTAEKSNQRDVLGRLVSTIEYGQRLDLLRQLALEGGARCATLPAQVAVVEALRQKGAAPLVAAAAAERLGDRCMAECFALNRQMRAAEELVAESTDASQPTCVADLDAATATPVLQGCTPVAVDFISKGRSSPDALALAVAGLQSASVIAIDAEWPPHWTEKQARLSGAKPLAALLQLAIVGGSSDKHVIIIDLLPELALSRICEAALDMLTDDSILKLGYSLSNDLRRVVPALQVAAGRVAGQLPDPTVPPSGVSKPVHAAHTSDDSEVSGLGQSSDDPSSSEDEQDSDKMMEDRVNSSSHPAEPSEGCLGPADVAKELDRLGCLEGTIPAADQLFDPDATDLVSADSSQLVKTILLSLKPAADDQSARVPLTIACVLGQERRLQLGRCASALGCPRSSLSLIPASELVSVCGFPRGAIGPIGLRSNSMGQAPRVLIDEELMPAELPTYTSDTSSVPSASSSNAQAIVSSDLEAAMILCGGGRTGLVYPIRPRKLLQALGDRGTVAMIHAESVRQTSDSKLSFLSMGRAGRRQKKHTEGESDTCTEHVAARHALDLQVVVGQMLPLRMRDGKQRKRKDGPMPSPGLADSISQVLGFTLDKAMQCSSWSDRPLSENQLQYAAKDAMVLHSLYERIASGGSRVALYHHF